MIWIPISRHNAFYLYYSGRRVSQIDFPSINLPPIDPTGPKLVSAPPIQDEVDAKSVVSEKKLSFLQEGEAKLNPPEREAKEPLFKATWSLSETKFASSGILSKLGKVLDALKEEDIEEVRM